MLVFPVPQAMNGQTRIENRSIACKEAMKMA